ncbi:MAG: AAA family ATPase [Thermodesulfobacteriota bacterium]
MGKITVITGRGGTGKSTFVTLFARFINPKSLLLIDLDPDGSLAKMFGVDLEKEGKLTISDALSNIIVRGKDSKGKDDTPDLLRRMMEEGEIIYRDKKFDLISLGAKFAPGCYCLPDEMIKETIRNIHKNYEMILVDSPAGLEHLNRKVTPDIDDLFVVLDPSEKSTKHIERIKSVTKGVKITYKNFYLVGNYRFTDEIETYLLRSGEKYLGRIAYDPLIREHNLKGESLLNIPEDSPSSTSVKKILREAGYGIVS